MKNCSEVGKLKQQNQIKLLAVHLTDYDFNILSNVVVGDL